MKPEQEFTPKYWVGHHKGTDDVFIHTANKSRNVTAKLMDDTFGEDWHMDESLEIILVEVNEVNL